MTLKSIAFILSTVSIASCTTQQIPEPPLQVEEYERIRGERGPFMHAGNHMRDNTLATLTLRRHISMFYKIHVNQDPTFARTMATSFEVNDNRIRSCYSTRLDAIPELRGDVALRFSLPAGRASLQNVTRVGGKINDAPFLHCLTRQLATIAFSSPRALQGVLVYEFDYREQEVSRGGRGRIERTPTPRSRR